MSWDWLIVGATVIDASPGKATVKIDRSAKERAKPDCKLAYVEMLTAINRGEHNDGDRRCEKCWSWTYGRLCRKCSGE